MQTFQCIFNVIAIANRFLFMMRVINLKTVVKLMSEN